MKESVRNFVNKLESSNFTNNNQRVLYQLLTELKSGNGWIVNDRFDVKSAGSRIRDLRKYQFGGFDILCRSAKKLGATGYGQTYYYKLAQRNLTIGKLKVIFGNILYV